MRLECSQSMVLFHTHSVQFETVYKSLEKMITIDYLTVLDILLKKKSLICYFSRHLGHAEHFGDSHHSCVRLLSFPH